MAKKKDVVPAVDPAPAVDAAAENEYPTMIYSTAKDGTVLQRIVNDAEARAKAGKAWRDSPDED